MNNSWLLLSNPDEESGRPSSWENETGSHYVWDSRVPNSRHIKEGDLLALRDYDGLLGISLFDRIEKQDSTAFSARCPRCGRSKIKQRVTKQPKYRCYGDDCGVKFDEPNRIPIEVTSYKGFYQTHWVDFSRTLDREKLLELSNRGQNSIKAIDWAGLSKALQSHNGAEDARQLQSLNEDPLFTQSTEIKGGHTLHVVRMRNGQSKFRESLFRLFDSTCFVTGTQPKEVLDAAHLYSYATVHKHLDFGGILLRKDIHTLFDRFFLTINPATGRVTTDKRLLNHPNYSLLNGCKTAFPIEPEQKPWFAQHFDNFMLRAEQ